MRYFLDTEFIEGGPSFPLILLSIGIVAEDGREFYVVNEDAPLDLANNWVKANVLPRLDGPKVGITKIAPEILRWMTDSKPEFWGYYADYDWVVFCQLFGTMMDLPKGWPMYCHDLKQWSDAIGAPKFDAPKGEHNALEDAKWNKQLYEYLLAQATPSPAPDSQPTIAGRYEGTFALNEIRKLTAAVKESNSAFTIELDGLSERLDGIYSALQVMQERPAGTIGLDGDTRRDWATDGPALERRVRALAEALREAKKSLDGIWAAIGDALCSGKGIEKGYANAVAKECREASAYVEAALRTDAPGEGK